MNRRSGPGEEHLARKVAPTSTPSGESGLLGIGRVGQQQPDPRVGGQRAHPGQVGAAPVHRVEVDLEVARVEDDPLGGVEGGGEGVGHRVGDRDELDLERADPAALAVLDRDERGPAGHAGLVDPVPGQCQGQFRAVDVDREVAQQVGQSAGVVLVAVGEDDPVDPVGVLPQIGEVRQDQVDSGHVRIGEHDPQSRTSIRPSTSMQAQLRPISPEAAEEDHPDARPRHRGRPVTRLAVAWRPWPTPCAAPDLTRHPRSCGALSSRSPRSL